MILEKESLIGLTDLKKLSMQLIKAGIGIRFRLMGEPWQQEYRQVVKIAGNGVLLRNPQNNSLITISNLETVMQFDIERPVRHFRSHFHYILDPSC